MKWPIVGESGAYNGGHQRVQIASENIVIILIYVSLLSMIEGLINGGILTISIYHLRGSSMVHRGSH